MAGLPSTFRSALRRLLGEDAFRSFDVRFPCDDKAGVFGLSSDQQLAIAVYTSIQGHYRVLNDALRADKLNSDLLLFANELTVAVDCLPICDDYVFRAIKVSDLADFAAQYAPGTRRRWPAFSSATRQSGKSFPGNVLFAIKSRTGRVLRSVSEMPEEDEILFPPGTSFDIIDHRILAERLVIWLEEV